MLNNEGVKLSVDFHQAFSTLQMDIHELAAEDTVLEYMLEKTSIVDMHAEIT